MGGCNTGQRDAEGHAYLSVQTHHIRSVYGVQSYIHICLNETFARDEWFGGVNVLFVGDILQFPPVSEAARFEKINNS